MIDGSVLPTYTSPTVSLVPIPALALEATKDVSAGGLWMAVVGSQRTLIDICAARNQIFNVDNV